MKLLSEERYMVKIAIPSFMETPGDVILEGRYSGFSLKNWPSIYRKMEWWEHRRPDEMPILVKKLSENDGYHRKEDVFNVSLWLFNPPNLVPAKHPSGCRWVAQIAGEHFYNAASLIPITEDQYNNTPKENKPSVGN